MRREILAIVVHCTFKDDGCIWKGEVRHLEVTYIEESTCDKCFITVLETILRYVSWSILCRTGLS